MLHKSCLVVLGGFLTLSACQTAPTRVQETRSRPFTLLADKATKPIVLTEDTVVLDARRPFEYGLTHVQNSYGFQWQNLAEKEETGELLRDLRRAQQKLALAGVGPSTPVVVVGSGGEGTGEEGRLAWTLLYLGVADVQVANISMFRKNWTNIVSPPAKNVPDWTAAPRDDLIVSAEEFRRLAADPKERLQKRIWIIDTRTTAEYFNKDPRAPGPAPDVSALQIEWKEFFSANGRPNPIIAKKLRELGVQPTDRVIVVSNRGVRSAAAAYALMALGFSRVQNQIGGWRGLLK